MKSKIHGIISIILFSGTFILSFISIQIYSTIIAILYLLIVLISFLIVIYSYCTKCKCHENNCAHLIIGPISKYMPKRKMDKYTLMDYIGVFMPISLIMFIPQYWLFKNKILFFIFWILSIIAFTEIICFVCKTCENVNCLLCKKSKKTHQYK